jgi:hypothetical protein
LMWTNDHNGVSPIIADDVTQAAFVGQSPAAGMRISISLPVDNAVSALSEAELMAKKINMLSRELVKRDGKIAELQMKIKVGNELEPSSDRRLDCFNQSTCFVWHHISHGRTGNKLTQLSRIEAVLAKCSGAVINPGPPAVHDSVVFNSPIQIFGKDTCRPDWSSLDDYENVIHQLSKCYKFNVQSYGRFELLPNCKFEQRSLFWRTKESIYRKVHLDQTFPAWLKFDFAAWTAPITSDTAVLHIRSGDIMKLNGSYDSYYQPVCDHYIQAFQHSKATCAMILAEDTINPCVAVVNRSLPCVHLLTSPQCGAACAFTIIARARILAFARSSFSMEAVRVFRADKRLYTSYCQACPSHRGGGVHYCVKADKAGLVPWRATPGQLDILRSRSAEVLQC